jgi:hypothetical protein
VVLVGLGLLARTLATSHGLRDVVARVAAWRALDWVVLFVGYFGTLVLAMVFMDVPWAQRFAIPMLPILVVLLFDGVARLRGRVRMGVSIALAAAGLASTAGAVAAHVAWLGVDPGTKEFWPKGPHYLNMTAVRRARAAVETVDGFFLDVAAFSLTALDPCKPVYRVERDWVAWRDDPDLPVEVPDDRGRLGVITTPQRAPRFGARYPARHRETFALANLRLLLMDPPERPTGGVQTVVELRGCARP